MKLEAHLVLRNNQEGTSHTLFLFMETNKLCEQKFTKRKKKETVMHS